MAAVICNLHNIGVGKIGMSFCHTLECFCSNSYFCCTQALQPI